MMKRLLIAVGIVLVLVWVVSVRLSMKKTAQQQARASEKEAVLAAVQLLEKGQIPKRPDSREIAVNDCVYSVKADLAGGKWWVIATRQQDISGCSQFIISIGELPLGE